MSDNDFLLITLGGLRLESTSGSDESAAPHRQKLAVLAVLALADQPLSRDALIALFWGDLEEARARHSLSNALSYLRGVLGASAIRRHRDVVALEPGSGLTVDCREFEAAVGRQDWAAALERYRGPFFDAIHPGGSPELEQWVDRHRARFEALFLKASAGRYAELAGAKAWEDASAVARRWLDAAPLSTDAALALLDALTAAGTRDADQRALVAFDNLVTRLGDEFDRRPERAVIQRAQAIVERLRASDATGEFMVPSRISQALAAESGVAPAVVEAPVRPAGRPRPRWLVPVLSAAAIAIGILLVRSFLDPSSPDGAAPVSTPPRPLVAVSGFRAPPDSATAWIGSGLAQMVVARLARSEGIEVVAPARLGELAPPGAPLSVLLDAARRVGATWAVSGSVTRSEQGLIVDVNVHQVTDGRLASLATLTASDPISLADMVAVRVLAAAGTSPEGPTLAEVETASPEAYENFIRFIRASDQGQEDVAIAALDAAIAADSGFVSALRERASYAFASGNGAVLPPLLAAFRRHESRATEFDRLLIASQTSFYGGEHTRSETQARALVERFPRDPRTHAWLVQVYEGHGRWADAERAVLDLLALDSLSVRSGTGFCVPCRAYGRLAVVRHSAGDLAGSEAAARRLVELAPELVSSWDVLATALAASGKYPEALDAIDSAATRGPTGSVIPSLRVRVLLMARRWAAAETLVRALRASGAPDLQPLALDLSATLAREQGRHRAAAAAIDTLISLGTRTLDLVAGASLGRLGRYRESLRRFAAVVPAVDDRSTPGLRAASRIGDLARAFAWHRALEADAAARVHDTVRLKVIADSLVLLGGKSYYARDWVLHHHVRGLLQYARGDFAAAATSFRAARFSHMGLGTTLAGEAKSLSALGRHEEALAVLRIVYAGPLDAMGRYLPRTEADWLMADILGRAGYPDSVALYRSRLRVAWAGADPEIRQLLDPAG